MREPSAPSCPGRHRPTILPLRVPRSSGRACDPGRPSERSPYPATKRAGAGPSLFGKRGRPAMVAGSRANRAVIPAASCEKGVVPSAPGAGARGMRRPSGRDATPGVPAVAVEPGVPVIAPPSGGGVVMAAAPVSLAGRGVGGYNGVGPGAGGEQEQAADEHPDAVAGAGVSCQPPPRTVHGSYRTPGAPREGDDDRLSAMRARPVTPGWAGREGHTTRTRPHRFSRPFAPIRAGPRCDPGSSPARPRRSVPGRCHRSGIVRCGAAASVRRHRGHPGRHRRRS